MILSFVKNKSGSLLVEVILVTFLFGVIGTGLISTLLTSVTSAKQGNEYVVATGYIQEGIEAVRSIRDQNWNAVTNGTHGLTTTNGYYEFNGVLDSLDNGIYTRTITIDNVFRTGSLSGDIAVLGVLDGNSKKVTVNVTWDVQDGRTQNIDSVFYVFNWDVQFWVQTLLNDFNAGKNNSSKQTSAVDGEVQLANTDLDWTNISTYANVDLQGGATVETLQIDFASDRLYTLKTSAAGNDFESVDISDVSVTPPSVINGYDANNCYDMVVGNGYAYLACDEAGSGSEVIILNAITMVAVGSIDLPNSNAAKAIDLIGTTLIIGRMQNAATDEVYFYNVINPVVPVLLGSIEIGIDVLDLETNGTYTFVATADNSKELIAIRNVDRIEVDSLDLAGNDNANTVHVSGTNVYVGRDNGTSYDLARVDGTDPVIAGMSLIASLELGTNVNDVSVDSTDSWLIAGTSNASNEAVIVNLTGFTQLAIMDISGSNTGASVEIFGGYVYIGTNNATNDLVLFSVPSDSWSVLALISSVNKSGNHNANKTYVVGTKTYLVTEQVGSVDELFIYDTTVPSNPVLLGSYEVGSSVYDIVVDGSYAYLATANNSRELDIINISNPAGMVRTGSYNASGNSDAYAVLKNGNTIFLGRNSSSDDEFYTVDVTDPVSPSVLDSVNFGSNINDLAQSGNYVFAATDSNSQELVIYNITNPNSISLDGSFNATGNNNAEAIDISGTLLALGRSGGSDLVLLDISDPTSPSAYSETAVAGDIRSVALDGTDGIFLAADSGGAEAQRWNITDPTAPVFQAGFDLSNNANGVFFDGTYVYYATIDNSKELQIIGPGVFGLSDYVHEGTITSQTFDSGSAETGWNAIEWTKTGTGNVLFRIRTADTEVNLETAVWVGSDGTSSTNYSVSGTSISTDPIATGTQWVQWKAYLSGSGAVTPVLENVSLEYSP